MLVAAGAPSLDFGPGVYQIGSLTQTSTDPLTVHCVQEADPATKAKYDSLAKQDKERYQREAGVQPKEDGPKKPRSAYILFSSDTRKEVVAANPSMKSSEVMKELGRLWKVPHLSHSTPCTRARRACDGIRGRTVIETTQQRDMQ